MKKLVLTALCALAFGACGDDGGGGPDVRVTDGGGVGPDADVPVACNPVTQAGCLAGEKCAQLVANDEPFLATTACVPDGTITNGGACTRGEAGANGFDDCVAGLDCLRGECVQICTSAGGDTCRANPDPGFAQGEYCTLYADLFSDEIGLCVAACDPTDDAVVDGKVVNAACGEDSGCYLNVGRGIAACAGTPTMAAGANQNDDCYGPMADSCFLNGCESGFAPILPDAVEGSTTNTCARYCTPADTYVNSVDQRSGVNDKCGFTKMNANGICALGGNTHECRFVQTFYGEPLNPVTQGFCVGTPKWYDCAGKYEFETLFAKVITENPVDPNAAFNLFCYDTETPLDTDPFLEKCDGFTFGCTSILARQPIVDAIGAPAPGPNNSPVIIDQEWLLNRLRKTPTEASKL